MDLSRRRFLVLTGHSLVVGGSGLLVACQSGQQGQQTIVVSPATSTPGGTTKPAIQPAASIAPATVPPAAASPATSPAASPGASPVAKPAASPAPSPVAAARGGAVGKPQYQMDAQHTGRSPHTGPRRLALVRSFDTKAPANRPADQANITSPDVQSSTAIGPDGTIYVTTFSGWTYALKDSSSARDRLDIVWRFRPAEGGTPAHATAALSRDGSTAYVPYTVGAAPNQKGVLFALRAPSSGQDAQIAWQTEIAPTPFRNTPAVTDDGTIYVVNIAALVAAVEPQGGAVKWTAQAGDGQQAQFGQTIKVGTTVGPDGTVYVPTLTGSLYAVAPPSGGGNQGSIKWAFDFGEHLGSRPLVATPVTALGNTGQDAVGGAAEVTIGPDGTLYVGANNSNYYALDASGNQKWLFEAERELAGIWTAGVLSQDSSVLYFGANTGGIYAVSARDGSLKWQFPIYGSVYSSCALDARGTLYTGSTVGSVYAIDSASGEKLAEYAAGAPVWSAPSIRPDGTLVVVDRQGRVHVLGES